MSLAYQHSEQFVVLLQNSACHIQMHIGARRMLSMRLEEFF